MSMWRLLLPRYWIDRLRIIKEQWVIGKKVMNVFEEIRKTLKMEIRLTSPRGDYLEAVITLQDLDMLHSLLKEHLGPPTKVSGKEVTLPRKFRNSLILWAAYESSNPFFTRKTKDR